MVASYPSYGFIYPYLSIVFHSIPIIIIFPWYPKNMPRISQEYSKNIPRISKNTHYYPLILYLFIMVIISMIVVSYYIHQCFPKTVPITVDLSSPLHRYISIVRYHCIHDVAHICPFFSHQCPFNFHLYPFKYPNNIHDPSYIHHVHPWFSIFQCFPPATPKGDLPEVRRGRQRRHRRLRALRHVALSGPCCQHRWGGKNREHPRMI